VIILGGISAALFTAIEAGQSPASMLVTYSSSRLPVARSAALSPHAAHRLDGDDADRCAASVGYMIALMQI
jgi:hypothetical protein